MFLRLKMYDGFHQSSFGGGGQQGHNSGGTVTPAQGAMLDMGMQYGQTLIQRSHVASSLLVPVEALKPYFRIDNRYVARKLGIVIMPFGRVGPRQRCGLDDDAPREGVEYFPPVDDVAAPDLYIPSMGLMTYVLATAFARAGTSPEVMAAMVGSACLMLLGEVLILKLAALLVQAPHEVRAADLAAWSGYKYVGVCMTIVLSTLGLPPMPLSLLMVYLAAASSYFMLMTLRPCCCRDGKVVMKTAPLLYGAALLQAPLYYWYASRAF